MTQCPATIMCVLRMEQRVPARERVPNFRANLVTVTSTSRKNMMSTTGEKRKRYAQTCETKRNIYTKIGTSTAKQREGRRKSAPCAKGNRNVRSPSTTDSSATHVKEPTCIS